MIDKNVHEGVIIWNGACSLDYGIGVENNPNPNRPERKVDVYSVPGRNGDIIMMQDAWENVVQEYDIFLNHGELMYGEGTQVSANHLAMWLMGPSGYCVLRDEWEEDCFRLAYYKGPLDIENLMNLSGRATIEFVCKPQRYLDSGQETLTIDSSTVASVHNPTVFKASPIITIPKITGAELPLTLTIGAYDISISNTSEAQVINCEEQNCYGTAGTNRNQYITLLDGQFPVLDPGDNVATLKDANNVAKTFTIVPNYWRL